MQAEHVPGVPTSVYACALLALSYGLNRVVGQIPLSVMAGVVIVTSAEAMDKWTHQLLLAVGYGGHSSTRWEIFLNLAMVFVVTALVVFTSVLVALGVGFAAALIAFIYRSNAQMIRRIRTPRSFAPERKGRVRRLKRSASTVAGLLSSNSTVRFSLARRRESSEWLAMNYPAATGCCST
jgi:MFS superfamily sulfate permease-like transporter